MLPCVPHAGFAQEKAGDLEHEQGYAHGPSGLLVSKERKRTSNTRSINRSWEGYRCKIKLNVGSKMSQGGKSEG